MADRNVLVRLRANADQFQREMVKARAAVKGLTDEVDTTNDRTAWLTQGILAIGPAAVTTGATAVPVLMGLATQATIGAAAIGTVALAFNGVGDALGALNDYQLEPSAKNFEKLSAAMEKIGPDGAAFVKVLDDVGAKLSVLQMDARAGMLPGMGEGLTSLLDRLPELRTIVRELASGVGQLSAEAGAGLAGPEFDEFFEFLATDGKEILVDTGRTLGNLADGFASLLVTFGPMTKSFTRGLLDMSRGFEQWAEELDSTEGFQAFADYISANGPDVLQMLQGFGKALVEIAKAAAPVGAIMVPALEALADAIALIADTPVGSFLILGAAITSLYGRIAALRTIAGGPIMKPFVTNVTASGKAVKASLPSLSSWGTQLAFAGQSAQYASDKTKAARAEVRAFGRAVGPAAASVGLLAVAMSPLPEKFGLTNTAMGAMTGALLGPWGAAVGAGVGLAGDLAAANNDLEAAIRSVNTAIASGDLDQMEAQFARLESTLADSRGWFTMTGDSLGAIFNGLRGQGWDSVISEAGVKLADLRSEIALTKQLSADGWTGNGIYQYLVGPLSETAEQAHAAALGVGDLVAEYERLNGVLTKQSDWNSYQAAIDAVTDSIKENGRTLNSNTAAGRANRDAINGVAEAAVRVSENLTGLDRVDFLKSARKSFKDAAIDAGGLDRKARDVLAAFDELIGQPPVKPKVNDKALRDAETKAKGLLGTLDKVDGSEVNPFVKLYGVPTANRQLAALTKPRYVAIRAFFTAPKGKPPGSATSNDPYRGPLEADGAGADGATVPKTGLPYADRHLYAVADGEEIVSDRKGQATAYRPVLKAINANMPRAAIKGMLADGGTAGRSVMSPGELNEYSRLFNVRSAPITRTASAVSGWATDPVVIERLAAIEAAVNRGTRANQVEHAESRRSFRRGAGDASRSKQGGYLG